MANIPEISLMPPHTHDSLCSGLMFGSSQKGALSALTITEHGREELCGGGAQKNMAFQIWFHPLGRNDFYQALN